MNDRPHTQAAAISNLATFHVPTTKFIGVSFGMTVPSTTGPDSCKMYRLHNMVDVADFFLMMARRAKTSECYRREIKCETKLVQAMAQCDKNKVAYTFRFTGAKDGRDAIRCA